LIALARHSDLRFDCLLSAELARSYKPAGAVYELAPQLLGLAPDEVMLVAAHPFDLQGARRAGLRSAFLDRPLEYGPGSPSRHDPEADVSVSSLHELVDALAD
jgi:2-haloacid dehalogenase